MSKRISRRQSTVWRWAMERPEAFSGRVQEQLSLLRKSPGLHWNHFRSLTEMSQVNYYQFPSDQICRYLCCFSPQHALLPHVLHVQRWELPQSVCTDVKLAAPAMLLPHESTVSHETQQEKGALTARQSTATQELTNGGSKVWVKVSINFNLAYAIIILIHNHPKRIIT